MKNKISIIIILFAFVFLVSCNRESHNLVEVKMKYPTCTEIGYSNYYICSDEGCDYKEGYMEVAPMGHDLCHMVEYKATCTHNGYTDFEYCMRCNEKFGFEVIDKLDHDLVSIEEKEATATEIGHSSYKKCNNCNYTENLEYYPCSIKLEDRYYVKNLDNKLYDAFMDIYNGTMNFESEIKFNETIKVNDLKYLMNILNYSCPELIQINGDYIYNHIGDDVSSVELTYIINENEYSSQLEEVNRAIKEICLEVAEKSVIEKEMFVYDYIINNCKYDKNYKYAGSVYGCLIDGVARCEGYSKTFMLLMWSLGFECYTVTGETNEKHSWNIVNIHNKYYMCDPTWDDLGENETVYGLFNVSYDNMKAANHIVDEYYLELANKCNSMEMCFACRNGSFIAKEEDVLTQLQKIMDSKIQDGYEKIYFKTETIAQYNVLRKNIESLMKEYLDEHYNNWKYDCVYNKDGLTVMFKVECSSPKKK